MREQASATSQLSLWWNWYKGSLDVWKNLLPDRINPSQERHHLSPWLACNAAYLEDWNRILVPWMRTPLFAQFLGTLAETQCARSAASIGLAQAEQAVQTARSEQEDSGSHLPAGVGQTPRRLVWTRKPARLYHYEESADAPVKYRTPLLMVYALINKLYILDLLPGRSLIDYLVQHGVDVYLLDWGIAGPQEQRLHFDDLMLTYLPVLNISAASDQIVSLAQTSSTLDRISSTEKVWIVLPGNHFGLVCSPKAVHQLWPSIVVWGAAHSHDSSRRSSATG